MLIVSHVSKSFGARAVLDDVSFVVNSGARIALVGPNGTGKSTLLRILAGLDRPTSGIVEMTIDAAVGYLPQSLEVPADWTIGDTLRSAIPGLRESRRRVDELASAMAAADSATIGPLSEAYADALEVFEQLGGYDFDGRIDATLASVGLSEVPPETEPSRLSGGQQTRLGLARGLVRDPDVVLLDEPTNHLDMDGLAWLERFLAAFRGALVVASHDRAFIDAIAQEVVALDAETHRARVHPGNYAAYVRELDTEGKKQAVQYRLQQQEIRRLQADIARTKQQAQATETKTQNDYLRGRSKKVAKKAKARERRLEKYLDRDDLIERPKREWQMNLDFGEMPRGGETVVTLSGLGHRFGERWLFRNTNLTLVHGERVALVGPNGCGKSTLLSLVAGALAPTEGAAKLGARVRPGWLRQDQSGLDPHATPVEAVRDAVAITETDARNFLHQFLLAGDEAVLKVESLSLGQRVRVKLACLVAGGANCLLMDEPMNHLDIPSRERMEQALDAFPGTVLVVSHDRAFIDRFATALWGFVPGAAPPVLTRFADRRDFETAGG